MIECPRSDVGDSSSLCTNSHNVTPREATNKSSDSCPPGFGKDDREYFREVPCVLILVPNRTTWNLSNLRSFLGIDNDVS
jgi:hypothetical protein